MSEIQLNNNISNLSYPVLTKNFISYGGLWYNINCIFEILQQIHQKALQIRQYKKKNSSHEATWLSCCLLDVCCEDSTIHLELWKQYYFIFINISRHK